MHTTRAAELPWPDLKVRLAEDTPLILPIGSYEQHGPHLPLGTDALIAESLAVGVAQRLGALALPTLPYGAPSRPRSGGGDLFSAPAFPLPTLMSAVESVAAGVVAAGCRWLIVLSWHMENAAVLWDALRAAAAPRTCPIQLFDAPWDFLTPELESELFPEGDPSWAEDHAGRLETAMMLHLARDLVKDAPAPRPFVPRRGYDVLPTPADAVPETGVVLDARNVNEAMGERSTDAMLAGIVDSVRVERRRHQ